MTRPRQELYRLFEKGAGSFHKIILKETIDLILSGYSCSSVERNILIRKIGSLDLKFFTPLVWLHSAC